MSDLAPLPTPVTATLQSSSYSWAQWTDFLADLHPDPRHGMNGSGCCSASSFFDHSDEDMKARSDHPFCALCEAFGWLQAWWAATFSDPASISNQFGEAVPRVHESAQAVQRLSASRKSRAHVSGSLSDYEVVARI